MFDFIFRKAAVQGAQKFIDQLNPSINVHVPSDIPIPSADVLKKMSGNVSKIKAMEEQIAKLSDDELRQKTKSFQSHYQNEIGNYKQKWLEAEKASLQAREQEAQEASSIEAEKAKEEYVKAKRRILDEMLPEAFAVVREAGKRVLNMRHFDVQMIGGMVLNSGSIAEMTTGEGKTLVATLPSYLNALTGDGVHVVTVNDYLARRDREWMGPLFEFLGLSVGVILHDMTPQERKVAYGCDITYGTNNEFGFDYLRDNMVQFKEDMVQRGHNFAVVDEVDSILVDEARTPLIISGPAEESTDKYYRAFQISKQLKGRRITEKDEIDAKYRNEDLTKGFDYMADEKARSINLTEAGETKAAQLFGIANLHEMETIEYRHHILQALKAKEFFKIDVEYVVRDGEVIIVDEFTGRLMPGRRWSDGLHQAVEAKEGIKIERENQTLATITFQNYFRMYEKLSGMTGTAYTEANEFKQINNLDVNVIPTNKKVQRVNHPDCIYKSQKGKYAAVVQEIEECNRKGQPVLVGTISIEKSELLSHLLKQKGIPHQVLNAKYHELEANIIAQAGRYKGVTIATNMAGRGTDIVLGGNPEFLAKTVVAQKSKQDQSPEETESQLKKFIEQYRVQCKEEHDKVVLLGGLHVIGTERHESRRIDNQLRGRQGRQGDPGSSRFYVSLEDDLMRLFASDNIMNLMEKLGMDDSQVLEHPWLSNAIETAQKRVENHNFEIRKHLLDFDNVMNKQREAIYKMRRQILESDDVKILITDAIEETISGAVADYLFSGKDDATIDIEGLGVYLKSSFQYDISPIKDSLKDMNQDQITAEIIEAVKALYVLKEKELEAGQMRYLERMLLLHTIDSKWKDHLYAMDQLKDSVGLRAYGQRDPLMEYKREAFQMFQGMYASIYQEVGEIIFKINPVTPTAKVRGVFSSLPQQLVHQEITGMSQVASQARPPMEEPMPANLSESGMGEGASMSRPAPAPISPIRKTDPDVGRNDPCPCGSGKKYKKCCGK